MQGTDGEPGEKGEDGEAGQPVSSCHALHEPLEDPTHSNYLCNHSSLCEWLQRPQSVVNYWNVKDLHYMSQSKLIGK